MEKSSKEQEQSWHDNPENWKLGIFYTTKKIKEFSLLNIILITELR